jgi:hypothetical protein
MVPGIFTAVYLGSCWVSMNRGKIQGKDIKRNIAKQLKTKPPLHKPEQVAVK